MIIIWSLIGILAPILLLMVFMSLDQSLLALITLMVYRWLTADYRPQLVQGI